MGTGIEHGKFNDAPIESVHLLQVWILPERWGLKDIAEMARCI